MGSEPKMPELPYRPPEGYSTDDLREYACELHTAWQAYAAGIRAEVIAEVRAVVPGAYTPTDYIKGFVEAEAAEAHNAFRADLLARLATLENPNE